MLVLKRHQHFVSEFLGNTKTQYPKIQKLLYAVLIGKHKIQHYFESHQIMVVTSFPLGEVVCNLDTTGRIAKWSLELMGQGITYAPRTAIKSQALADFMAEWTQTQLPPALLAMFFNGSLMKMGAGLGLVFISPWRPNEVHDSCPFPYI